jgi:hypothetical protein
MDLVRGLKLPRDQTCVGITTHLSRVLRGGTKFAVHGPRIQAGKGSASKAGMARGSKSDLAVERFINHGESCAKNKPAVAFFRALKQVGIRPIRAKVYVSMPSVSLSAIIDAVGVMKDGTLVVLEQKTTQYSRKQHMEMYHTPCSKRRKLANGLPNTTFHAHQLQTALGMLALARQLPRTRIIGKVVVCLKDDARVYDVRDEFVNPAFFTGSTPAKREPAARSFAKPESKSGKANIMTAVAALGFRTAEPLLRYGSLVASAGDTLLVVGLVHSDPKTKAVAQRRRDMQAETKRLWLAKKKKRPVRGCLLYYSTEGVYRHEFVSSIKRT